MARSPVARPVDRSCSQSGPSGTAWCPIMVTRARESDMAPQKREIMPFECTVAFRFYIGLS
jgi:hypothetical protein